MLIPSPVTTAIIIVILILLLHEPILSLFIRKIFSVSSFITNSTHPYLPFCICDSQYNAEQPRHKLEIVEFRF